MTTAYCGWVARAGLNRHRGALAMPIRLAGWLPRKSPYTLQGVNRRAITEGGVAAREVEWKGELFNNPFKPTRFAASRRLLAQASRRLSRAA